MWALDPLSDGKEHPHYIEHVIKAKMQIICLYQQFDDFLNCLTLVAI